jgi:tRNA-splicing ligase RtcB
MWNTMMIPKTNRIGVQLHDVTLNLTCNYDRLFDYIASLVGEHACPVWDESDLEVTAVWHTEPLPEGVSAFNGNGADGIGKRMLRRDDELVWFDTHRDKDLQLRFRGNGHGRRFDVDYTYRPSQKKLANYPDYEQRKFFNLLRYLVHFPIAWHLERTRGWSLIHASAVACGDKGVLIAGPGGAGKTTTCLGLMSRGMSLITENLLFSNGDRIVPLPEPIRLTAESLALLSEDPIRLETLPFAGGVKHKSMFRAPEPLVTRPVRPAAIFIPQFAQPGFVRPIDSEIAAELLGATNRLTLELNDYYWYTAALDLLWPAPGNAERQLRVLQRLTASTPCYSLGIDRSVGVEPVIDRILMCLSQAGALPATERRRPIEIRAASAVPIRCFSASDLLPDQAARAQLEALATVSGLVRHVSVLPDVHFKSSNPTPTGTVAVSRDVIVPRAIDAGTNCGMRIVATSIPSAELAPQILDALYGRLRDAVPIEAHERPVLTDAECEEMLASGLSAVRSALDLGDDELGRIENHGRMMPEIPAAAIRAVVPAKAIRKGNPWLGTLGAGNHFLELQEITEVLNDREARALGLELGHVVFMMHTDSRRLGKQIMKPLRDEAEQTLGLRETGHPNGPDGLWSLPIDSDLGQRLVCGLAAASHAALANRAAITRIVRQTVRAVLADASLKLPLVYDCGHETIQRERHGGEWLWVHRHGASSARPPGVLTHDPILAAIGQPVPVPGSMGSDSYIGVAQPGVAATFHSVAHGAGRVMQKVEAAETYDPSDVESGVRSRGIRLYRYGTDNIAGQAPASFKNVQRVVEAMEALDLIRPVVRLRPVAVLKG